MPKLTLTGFADMFGTTADRIPENCKELIAAGNWTYHPLESNARDATILDILDRIEHRKLSVVANEDKSRWVKGWGENLEAFEKSGGDTDALVPKYIRTSLPIRLNQNFVRTEDPDFELHWYAIFRSWFLQTYLAGFDHIFEFGCGSGHNVAEMARIFPNASIHGLDWAQPSVEIVEKLRQVGGLNTHGQVFDFFHPDYSLEFPENSAVLTMGALEQTGNAWGKFLEFIMSKKPRMCFHVEPIYEWYDTANLVDYTACKAHEIRNFLRGFPPYLVDLEKHGKVKIEKSKRTMFGSLMMEGYSQIIWTPNVS